MKEFKLVIAGSRDFNDFKLLTESVYWFYEQITSNGVVVGISIISGAARGADKLGEQFAKEHNCKLYSMPAEWVKYGKSAGYRRNVDMGNVCDGALIFWDGKSKGTKHMIDLMSGSNKPYHVVRF